MQFEDVATNLTVDVYKNLKTAVEIGRWPDGRIVSKQQRQICLEAILCYEVQHLPPEQRTGYLPPKIGTACDSEHSKSDYDETQPLQWRD